MPETDNVFSVIEAFRNAKSGQEIEKLADRLTELADMRAAEVLVYRLGDSHVQEDPDVEDAVCSALVRLGIMEQRGNLNFHFKRREEIPSVARDLVHERYRMLIPSKYFKDPPRQVVKGIRTVHLDAVAKQGDQTILVFSCPHCCTGNEGIKSELQDPLRSAVLNAVCSGQGVASPCPNCGMDILLVADDDLRGHIEQLLLRA